MKRIVRIFPRRSWKCPKSPVCTLGHADTNYSKILINSPFSISQVFALILRKSHEIRYILQCDLYQFHKKPIQN